MRCQTKAWHSGVFLGGGANLYRFLNLLLCLKNMKKDSTYGRAWHQGWLGQALAHTHPTHLGRLTPEPSVLAILVMPFR